MPSLPRVITPGAYLRPLGVALAAGCGCAAVWVADPTVPGGPIPVCPTKALFGIDCPGCGASRMLYCLMHGDLESALRFNALAMLGLVLLGWVYLTWTYGRVTGRPVGNWRYHRMAGAAMLALALVWFVVRNLPFAPFTALYV